MSNYLETGLESYLSLIWCLSDSHENDHLVCFFLFVRYEAITNVSTINLWRSKESGRLFVCSVCMGAEIKNKKGQVLYCGFISVGEFLINCQTLS